MTKRIASLFALTTFVLAVGGSAFAADIAVKAPLPAPAPGLVRRRECRGQLWPC
jgi:hypothetical protein